MNASAIPPHALPDAGEAQTLAVDFATLTGAVHGGATGMLYGLGDPGVPSSALIAGARPRTMAQKAPAGLQHPNGDALATSAQFFDNGGAEMLVYMQDVYSEWPYEQLGIEHYLAEVRRMVTTVAADPNVDKFSWVPFNEPDWIWYPDWETHRETFFSDWKAVYTAIRAILPNARIVGPNEMDYNHQRLVDFITWAAAEDLLPDVISWHELKPQGLADYRAHYADYRQIEASLGLQPLPININEYGNRRDTSNPGQMIQWIAMFEETKVDADMAYWTFAGNLDDHTVRTGEANGGWWLLKWYADLTGQTAALTPPSRSEIDTLQGIATLDLDRHEATVIFGGTGSAVTIEVTGLPAGVFDEVVDVSVVKTSWSGYEGAALSPPVLARARQHVRNGTLSIPTEGGDPMAAYRVRISAPERDVAAARAPWTERYEAEHATLTSAQIVDQTDDPQKYATSGGADVSGLDSPDSAVTFTVDVPADGVYTLAVFYGTNGTPSRMALYVDDEPDRVLVLPATLKPRYRGRLDVDLALTQGKHLISLRSSTEEGPLAGSNAAEIALDCIDLTQQLSTPSWTYTARVARLSQGATLRVGDAVKPAAAALGTGGVATFFVAVADDGYHDLVTTFNTPGAATVSITADGRTIQNAPAEGAGTWQATSRTHLPRGISVIQVSSPDSDAVEVAALTLTRTPSADTATITVAAAAAQLSGAATIESDPYAFGGNYVADAGSGAFAITIVPDGPRRPGPFNLTVSYANAQQNTASHYNTDVINRFATISEVGGASVRAIFKHSYAWNNFWTVVVPLDLVTTDGALTIGNAPDDPAPNIDYLALSPLVLASTVKRIEKFTR